MAALYTMLPYLGLAALGLAIWRRQAVSGSSDLLLRTAVAGGVVTGLLTELLSAGRWLTQKGVAWAWGATTLLALIVALTARRRDPSESTPATAAPREKLQSIEWLWIGAVVVVLTTTAYLALAYPPTDYDAMTYRLARVGQWMQHRQADFYATHNRRHLHMPPWSEYAILHGMLLDGSDLRVNLVQWYGLCLAVVAVGAIARELGGSRQTALAASFLVATLPMAILQASNVQNDLTMAAWLLCLIYFQLCTLRAPTLGNWLGVGLSLGLALWTKSTAYLFAAPQLAWFAWAILRKHDVAWRHRVAGAALMVSCVLALNGTHYWRNSRLHGHPLGTSYEDFYHDAMDTSRGAFFYRNGRISPEILVSNLMRCTAVLGSMPGTDLDQYLDETVRSLHDRWGMDVDNPDSTWRGTSFKVCPTKDFKEAWYYRSNGFAPAPLHLWLFVVLGVVGVCRGWAWPTRRAAQVGWAVLGGYLLFCLLLRWQPWHNRLLVPLLMCACAPAALILGRRPALAGLVTLPLVVAAWPCVSDNLNRPLFDDRPQERADRIFVAGDSYRDACRYTAQFLLQHGLHRVGWIGEPNSLEYPFWREFTQFATRYRCLEHVQVENQSRPMRCHLRDPQALVVVRTGTKADTWRLNGRRYQLALDRPPFRVYVPVQDATASNLGR